MLTVFGGPKRAYTGRLSGVCDQQSKIQYFACQQFEACNSYRTLKPIVEECLVVARQWIPTYSWSEVQWAAHKWWRDQPKIFLLELICKLVNHCTKCIGKERDYKMTSLLNACFCVNKLKNKDVDNFFTFPRVYVLYNYIIPRLLIFFLAF